MRAGFFYSRIEARPKKLYYSSKRLSDVLYKGGQMERKSINKVREETILVVGIPKEKMKETSRIICKILKEYLPDSNRILKIVWHPEEWTVVGHLTPVSVRRTKNPGQAIFLQTVRVTGTKRLLLLTDLSNAIGNAKIHSGRHYAYLGFVY